jgi:hypothetical protein
VVRWVLREHGVTLAGPPPAMLIDTVTADQLRAEVTPLLADWAAELRRDPAGMESAWRQPYTVLSYCRILHTIAIGQVTSKLAAGHWALDTLDPSWQPLIQDALDGRPDPWLRVHRRADPALVAETWAFVDYAIAYSGV